MLTTAHYFEHDRYVGSCTFEREYAWPSQVLFCTRCGQAWGRIIHQAGLPSIACPEWQILSRRCVKCGDGQFLEHTALDCADKALLTREVLALIGETTNDN